MNAETFFDSFDLLSEAPNSVAKLRQLILTLAIERRLVARDPDSCSNGESTVVQDYVVFQNGYAFKSEWFLPKGVRLLRNANIGIGQLNWNDVEFVSKERANEFERFALSYGDIVVSLDRPIISSGLKVARLGSDDLPALLLQRVARAQFTTEDVLPEYFYLWLNTPAFIGAIDPGRSNGVPHISTRDIQKIPFSAPPIGEQRRIVAKVDELLGLCDELETRQGARRELRERLVQAALDQLLASRDPADFATHWQRIQTHFDILFDTPKALARLRDAILYLAYSGKLVRQNPSFGNGQRILDELNAQRSRSEGLSVGKRKKATVQVERQTCQGVFAVPDTWSWSHLELICEMIGDVDHNMPKAVADGVPFLSAKDLKDDGTLDFSDAKMISEEDYLRLSRKIQMRRGDIVYSRIGARLGKARLVEVDTRFLISYSCCLVRTHAQLVNRRFVQIFLDSKLALNQAHNGAQSIGVPDLGLGEIKAFQIPVPPLAEQDLIVEKVTELLDRCRSLETRFAERDISNERLLGAVVRDLLVAGPQPTRNPQSDPAPKPQKVRSSAR